MSRFRNLPEDLATTKVELVEMAGDSIIRRLGEMTYEEGLRAISRSRRDLQMVYVETGRLASWSLR